MALVALAGCSGGSSYVVGDPSDATVVISTDPALAPLPEGLVIPKRAKLVESEDGDDGVWRGLYEVSSDDPEIAAGLESAGGNFEDAGDVGVSLYFDQVQANGVEAQAAEGISFTFQTPKYNVTVDGNENEPSNYVITVEPRLS
jgi:hypothetical protein